MKTLIGKKIGMTQIYTEAGQAIAVTVIDVSNNVVTKELKSGDIVTHIEIGKDVKKNPNNADKGNYKALSFVPVQKIALVTEEPTGMSIGTKLEASLFEKGDIVDVQGISKGKGFQGVMKRWGFKGGKATHGQSDRDRAPGSIGSGTTIGRVIKGMKMAGRMGRSKTTIKKLRIEAIDTENSLILVSGSVPGKKGGYVVVDESYFNKKVQ